MRKYIHFYGWLFSSDILSSGLLACCSLSSQVKCSCTSCLQPLIHYTGRRKVGSKIVRDKLVVSCCWRMQVNAGVIACNNVFS